MAGLASRLRRGQMSRNLFIHIDSHESRTQCSWRLSPEIRMFRGLQSIRPRIKSVRTVSDTDALHCPQVLKLQFPRTNTAMAAADGAAGATAKTLKMENARCLLRLKDRG